jgi:hypothetical protein
MRGGFASEGLRGALIDDDPLPFGPAFYSPHGQ